MIKTTLRGGFFIYLSAVLTQSRIILVALLFALSLHVHSQSMQEEFYDQWERQDTNGMLVFLQEWKLAEPYNPDVYVGFFNYYAIQTFEEESVLLETMPLDSGEYQVVKDSVGQVTGYRSQTMVINDSILNVAFDWVDKGIHQFPDRLDLRMGKVYLAIETDRWYLVQSSLKASLDAGDSIHHGWKWMKEETLHSGQHFLFSSIQVHLLSLFEKQDSSALEVIREVSQCILKQDKQQYFALTNLATVAMIQEHYALAMEWLKKADKIHENDPSILSNLGYCSWQLGDLKKAKKYYQMAMAVSDEEGKASFQRQLDRIDLQDEE